MKKTSNDNSIKKKQRAALIVGICTSFVTTFAGSSLNLSIPAISQYFNMGATSVTWIVSIYMLTVAVITVPFGKVADSTNRRTVLIIGTALFGIMGIVAVFSINAAMIIACRGFMGLGASMIFATNMPIAMSAFEPHERGKVIGLVVTGVYLGLALGPVLGGFLNSAFGWKSIFVVSAAVSLIGMLVVIKGLPNVKNEHSKFVPDVPGNILLMLMIGGVLYGLSEIGSIKFAWAFIAMGLAFGVAFVKRELKAENPVIDVSLFARDRIFTYSNLTALFNYSSTFAIGYLGSIYLQVVLAYSSGIAGAIILASPLFMAIMSPKMGKMSDKVSAYKLVTIGMIISTASLLYFTFIQADSPLVLTVIVLAVSGVGNAMFSSPNTNVIMGCVHPSKFGVANSILSTMRTIGQASCMAIIMMVIGFTIGNVSIYSVSADELLNTMHISFAIFTALCAMGIFMSLKRRKS